MVNIIAVVSINSDAVITFKNIDEWWQYVLDKSTPTEKTSRVRLKTDFDRTANELATMYGISPLWTKDVCFLFGSQAIAKQRMADYETRELLVNPRSKIVYQIRSDFSDDPSKVIYVVSIHCSKIFKSFMTQSTRETNLTINKDLKKEE